MSVAEASFFVLASFFSDILVAAEAATKEESELHEDSQEE
jgi:hypothetical protein